MLDCKLQNMITIFKGAFMKNKKRLLSLVAGGLFVVTGCAGKTATITTSQETKIEKTCGCHENKKTCCEATKAGSECTCKSCNSGTCEDPKSSAPTQK